jgi:hypothetical protein
VAAFSTSNDFSDQEMFVHDLGYREFDLLEGLPIAPSRKGITVLPVSLVGVWAPSTRAHPFNEFRCNAVSLSG